MKITDKMRLDWLQKSQSFVYKDEVNEKTFWSIHTADEEFVYQNLRRAVNAAMRAERKSR